MREGLYPEIMSSFGGGGGKMVALVHICLPFQDTLQPLSMQALPAPPESLCIVEMSSTGEEDTLTVSKGLFLSIGLLNGVLLRTSLDAVTGDLSDTRTRCGCCVLRAFVWVYVCW